MKVALFLLVEEITQVKEAIPWVHCASGNVWFICIFVFLFVFEPLESLALFKHMNEQWCEHLNTGAGGTELLLVNIFVFSPPCDPYVFVFIHMNVFVSPCEYICVFAAGIPASLIHIPGSQPVVIPPSVDMSEFVDFSPLCPGHTPSRTVGPNCYHITCRRSPPKVLKLYMTVRLSADWVNFKHYQRHSGPRV